MTAILNRHEIEQFVCKVSGYNSISEGYFDVHESSFISEEHFDLLDAAIQLDLLPRNIFYLSPKKHSPRIAVLYCLHRNDVIPYWIMENFLEYFEQIRDVIQYCNDEQIFYMYNYFDRYGMDLEYKMLEKILA